MKPIIFDVTILRNRNSSCSTRGNSFNFSFSYSTRVEKVGNKVIDRNSKIKVFFQKGKMSTYNGTNLSINDICFVESKLPGSGDTLGWYRERRGDTHIKLDKGFIFYKGNVYIAKITKNESVSNGVSALDSTELRTPYTIELVKKIKLPKEGVVALKAEYKAGGKTFTWNSEKQSFEC